MENVDWFSREQARLATVAPDFARSFPELLCAHAPDADMARANWEQLSTWPETATAVASLPAADLISFFRLIGSSPSLTRALLVAGPTWPALLQQALAGGTKSAAAHVDELAASADVDWAGFATALRRHRQREYLRIGANDLSGRFSVDVTMAELSALADAAFEASYRWGRRRVENEYGELCTGDEPTSGVPGFVVIGMGKLGGAELNYSSDVDVLYLYESDAGETSGGPRGRLTAREFFFRIAELITRALHEVTEAGFVFRVDLRLRPDGINGPIANSLGGALLYYESWGQTWERTAMLKARAVAGDRRLGERFLAEIRPFVYRRYLDYTTVADMKAMKGRMEAEMGTKARRGNVKLGPGGIREIEFVTQVLQLIHGGRDDRLRERSTIAALQRLVAGGYLVAPEGDALITAYRFLRDVEHKIQIVHERQTHAISTDTREQETLARRLLLSNPAALWEAVDRLTADVRRAFDQLFYEPTAEVRRSGAPAAVELFEQLDDHDGSVERLRALGFAEPEDCWRDLLLLRDGPRSAPARPRRRQALLELAPALLNAIVQSANPDQAVRLLTTYLSATGARTSLLALLRENPGTMQMLIRLFAGSQFLANVFLRHPEALDTLVRADLARVRVDRDNLRAEIEDLLRGSDDFEAQLDVLRRFRNEHFVRIGINDLEGLLDPDAVVAELTTLAEVCLGVAFDLAALTVCRRFGVAEPPGTLVLVAMGKLGSGELNYNSDLDLIFVYEAADDRGVTPPEFFAKLAQQLLTILQVPTREGFVYRIDTRLRPSGRSGPLVSSLESFRHYHEQSAQIWERQALIRARPVVGEPRLASTVERIMTDFVYRRSLTDAEAEEIHRLRTRMEHELARETRWQVNIKTGRGGLVDVEFATQMLQLRHGHDVPAVRVRPTAAALTALANAGALPCSDYAALAEGYRFLRRLENRMRLAHDRAVEALERGDPHLGPLARQLGFSGTAEEAAGALWEAYQRHRDAIRACYLRLFRLAEPTAR